MADKADLERLKEWATASQVAVLDALIEHGSIRKAARALDRSEGTVRNQVERVKAKAAAHGYSPDHGLVHPVPAPFVARGHSTFYDSEGKVRGQWVKSRLDERLWADMVCEAVRCFAEETLGPVPVPPPPEAPDPEVIPWVQLGDSHLAMLAHEAETGKHFDMAIAEREILTAFAIVLSEMRPVDRLVLNDLGDFTHAENLAGETSRSGNRLDMAARLSAVIPAYSRIMRALVEMLLTKATVVDVIINPGNHSELNDHWMREVLRVAFGSSGRVNVVENPVAPLSPFVGYRMGETFVMTTHGHRTKFDKLCGVMISDFREDFGETRFHYIDVGHIHHKQVWKEHPEIVVESFNTLTPGDQYHHDAGYRARQSLTVVYRSRSYGEVGRRVLPIEEVWAAVRKGHSAAYVPVTRRSYRV